MVKCFCKTQIGYECDQGAKSKQYRLEPVQLEQPGGVVGLLRCFRVTSSRFSNSLTKLPRVKAA